MNCHTRLYYCNRNRQIQREAQQHSRQELAQKYGVKPARIFEIVTYSNPDRVPCEYRPYRRDDDEAAPSKPRYVYFQTLAALKKEPHLLYMNVLVDINGCWNWRSNKNRMGYGYVKIGRARLFAHRVAAFVGGLVPNPRKPKKKDDPYWVLHTCDNPSCINPSHLRPGTIKDNNADKIAKGRARNGATGKLPKKEAVPLLQ